MKIIRTVILLAVFFQQSTAFYSHGQGKAELKIFDSLKVCDGYIMRMGQKKCQIIDRKGNTVFNCPGSIVSFFNSKNEMASLSSAFLVVYNKDLDVIWRRLTYIHHEVTVTPDDHILVLSHERKTINHINILFDMVMCFNSSGKKLYEWNTYDQRRYLLDFIMKDKDIFQYHIKGSMDPDSVLLKIAPSLNITGMTKDSSTRELFHMNAIQVIPENESEKKDTVFRKGNILLCFCNYNDSLASFTAIVDPANYNILWHYVQKSGGLMHTPSMLPNGHILVYINSSSRVDSSVIEEIDPLTKKVVWSYTEKFPDPWKRNGIGSCQRLPNGNTLISNGNAYVYEVTPDKKTVWQWFITEAKKPVYRAYWFSRERLKWLVDNE